MRTVPIDSPSSKKNTQVPGNKDLRVSYVITSSFPAIPGTGAETKGFRFFD